MARLSGTVRLRPVRLAFLVPPDDLDLIARVAQLSACLWGGRYNPIIPYFESGGERWTRPYLVEDGLEVARGYVDFFEPDTLVEAVPGMATKLGWHSEPHMFDLPRVVSLADFYEVDSHGRVQFAAGIDVTEAMQELYDTEYKYERRHKRPFADVEQSPGNAFFDVVGGRYPADERLSYIRGAYEEIFAAEKLTASVETAMKNLKEGYAGPLWVTRHGLEESFGRRISDQTFCIFDPTDPGDVIDLWNYRLIERRAIPINVHWIGEQSALIRDAVAFVHRPIPNNPFGTKFHTDIQFGFSVSDDKASELTATHFSGLPEGSFYRSGAPRIWKGVRRGRERRESKVVASGKPVAFDEELGSERGVKLPAPAPTFLNATERYIRTHWINIVTISDLYQRADPATVYPSNLWAPKYPRLGTRDLRIGREGWVLHQQYGIGYSHLELQEGRAAIIGWLEMQGIEATPSEEGQVAARVMAAAETLLGCGMFADRKTLTLLNEMAESHTEVNRQGRRIVRSTPDRSKHVQQLRQHFEDRKKRSFGFWNSLEHFLSRSVFRAGLSVQCPVCSYHNWFAVDDLGYDLTCSRCLNPFQFSQAPNDLHRLEWYYRVTGPFTAPDYARGAYAVALTLRVLAQRHESRITWSTGLRLRPLNCEVDFVAWHQRAGIGTDDERDEPVVIIGEAKSFGIGSINDEAIQSLKKVTERLPGAVMVVSSLRDGSDYTLAEIGRLRHLCLWGRRKTHQGQPINPLIVLTGAELFARYDIAAAWKEIDGKELHAAIDMRDLHTLAELTQSRYLRLQSHWVRDEKVSMPEVMSRLLSAIRGRAMRS